MANFNLDIVVHCVSMLIIVSNVEAAINYNITITEEGPPGLISNVVSDARLVEDFPQSLNQLSILLLSTSYSDTFTVVNNSLYSKSPVDREKYCPTKPVCFITLNLVAIPQQNEAVNSVLLSIGLNILDINDNPPQFALSSYNESVSEAAPIETTVGLPRAVDLDSPANGIVQYTMSPVYADFALQIVTIAQGNLVPYLKEIQPLDRNTVPVYTFRLTCTDTGGLFNSTQVSLIVLDVNDNPPIFQYPVYNVTVPENLTVTSTVLTVHATDADTGVNAEIQYSISSEDGASVGLLFYIDAMSGEISLNNQLNYETAKTHTLVVAARDVAPPQWSTTATVYVTVSDFNDNAPQITLNAALGDVISVPENSVKGTSVLYITVQDPDTGNGGKFNCSTSSTQFFLEQIGSSYSVMRLVTNVNVITRVPSFYDIQVTCTDKGVPPLTSNKSCRVVVVEVNRAPVFPQSLVIIRVNKTAQIGTQLVVMNASDNDTGPNGQIDFSIEPANPYVAINASSGAATIFNTLNYQITKQLNLTIVVRDHGQPRLSATATLIVNILNTDANPPVFNSSRYNFQVLENQPVGTRVGHVFSADIDGPPFDNTTYWIVSPEQMFRIDPETGNIFTNQTFNLEKDSEYNITVQAMGQPPNNFHSEAQVIIDILDVNGMTPYCIFPSPANPSVSISRNLAAGSFVTTIVCSDGDNDELHFHIDSQPNPVAFVIDERTGNIYTTAYLSSLTASQAQLKITVSDSGTVPKSNTTNLLVILTNSLGNDQGAGNQVAATCIGVIGGVLVVGLLLAILLICRRRSNRKKRANQPKQEVPVVTAVGSRLTAAGVAGSDRSSTRSEGDQHRQLERRNRLVNGGFTPDNLNEQMSIYPPPYDIVVLERARLKEQLQVLPDHVSRYPSPDAVVIETNSDESNTDSGHGSNDDNVYCMNRSTSPTKTPLAVPPRHRQFSLPPPNIPPRAGRSPPTRRFQLTPDLTSGPVYNNHFMVGQPPSRTQSESMLPPYVRRSPVETPVLSHVHIGYGDTGGRDRQDSSLDDEGQSVMYIVGNPPHSVHFCSQV